MPSGKYFKIIENILGFYNSSDILAYNMGYFNLSRFRDDGDNYGKGIGKTVRNNFFKPSGPFQSKMLKTLNENDFENQPGIHLIKHIIGMIMKVPSSKRTIELLQNGETIEGTDTSWDLIFKYLDKFPIHYYEILKSRNYLPNIIEVPKNREYTFQMILPLLLEASFTNSFCKAFIDMETTALPINLFLKDGLTSEQSESFRKSIDVGTRKYKWFKSDDQNEQYSDSDHQEAQRKEYQRIQTPGFYRKRPKGEKVLDPLIKTYLLYDADFGIFYTGTLSFIYSKFLVFQNENGNTASYRTMMSDFSEAVDFLRTYQG